MTKEHCPFCGTTYSSTYAPLELSPRQKVVYEAVLASGRKGIQAKKLIEASYDGKPPKSAHGVLRVNIFEINRKIRYQGHKIKGRRDAGYFMVEEPIPPKDEAELQDIAQD